MTKKKEYPKNSYYHIYNRGSLKAPVFYEEGDSYFFLYRMRDYSIKTNIALLAYCLMPNHFHLFVKQREDEPKVIKFISLLANSYTKFMNTKYSNRTGVVFQGPTNCKQIMDDSHLIWITRYIIDNPLKAGLVKRPEEWKFSSAQEYQGLAEMNLCDQDELIRIYSDKAFFNEVIWNQDPGFTEKYFGKF